MTQLGRQRLPELLGDHGTEPEVGRQHAREHRVDSGQGRGGRGEQPDDLKGHRLREGFLLGGELAIKGEAAGLGIPLDVRSDVASHGDHPAR